MHKIVIGIAGLLTVGALAVPVAAASGTPAASSAAASTVASSTSGPYCGITWGSLVKKAGSYTGAPISGVRAGRHACFDRLVVDVAGKAKGYRVEYVGAVRQDGSGLVVPLRGGAKLQIIALAPAYDANGNVTFWAGRAELVDVSGFSTFRQVAGAGSFEGQTTIGLGVRARLPFRVFILDGPGSGSRLVVDVSHRW